MHNSSLIVVEHSPAFIIMLFPILVSIVVCVVDQVLVAWAESNSLSDPIISSWLASESNAKFEIEWIEFRMREMLTAYIKREINPFSRGPTEWCS
jgi:hypothetical protein